MAGIYVHIPFCKKACHYCNFHFSTSLSLKSDLLAALTKEIALTAGGSPDDATIETIYLGGGTPSLLLLPELNMLMEALRHHHRIDPSAEITLEANPDDIDTEKIAGWKLAGINRLSIGVQSFFDEDLRWMNRAHDAGQALRSLELALAGGFDNITIDLIFGTPGLTDARWQENVLRAIGLGIPHLSCYALTVEPATALQAMIEQKKWDDIDPERQASQFLSLMDWMEAAGYEHYEVSNFAKPGKRSRHNASYWQGKKYLGLGPSAHSFDGRARQWNISNNALYIQSIRNNVRPVETEVLTMTQQLNEYIMTSLRTIEGLDLGVLGHGFGSDVSEAIWQDASRYVLDGRMIADSGRLRLTKQGMLYADGIAADLFRS